MFIKMANVQKGRIKENIKQTNNKIETKSREFQVKPMAVIH